MSKNKYLYKNKEWLKREHKEKGRSAIEIGEVMEPLVGKRR